MRQSTNQVVPEHSIPLRRNDSRKDLSQNSRVAAAGAQRKSNAVVTSVQSRGHSRRSSQRMCVDQVAERAPSNGPSTEYRPFGPRLALERVNTSQNDYPEITLGSTTLGDYQRISVLGKGTYGEVYKCVHRRSRMVVAMKTFIFEVSE